MVYSASSGKWYRMRAPPCDPNGRSSLIRSSWTRDFEILNVSTTGWSLGSPIARRHVVRAELGGDFLPDFFIAGDVLDVQRVEHQPRRFQPAVMAGHAVFAEDFTRRHRQWGGWRSERRLLADGSGM